MSLVILAKDVWEISPVTDHSKFQVHICQKAVAQQEKGVLEAGSFLIHLPSVHRSKGCSII
jgi:hypothetical protein